MAAISATLERQIALCFGIVTHQRTGYLRSLPFSIPAHNLHHRRQSCRFTW